MSRQSVRTDVCACERACYNASLFAGTCPHPEEFTAWLAALIPPPKIPLVRVTFKNSTRSPRLCRAQEPDTCKIGSAPIALIFFTRSRYSVFLGGALLNSTPPTRIRVTPLAFTRGHWLSIAWKKAVKLEGIRIGADASRHGCYMVHIAEWVRVSVLYTLVERPNER